MSDASERQEGLPAEEPELPDSFRPDRREHAKAPEHLDDDQLARLTEEERVEAGVKDYDREEVPPATDEPGPEEQREESGESG